MANILAAGTTAASSSDFVVVAGTPNTIVLTDAAGPSIPEGGYVSIQFKAASGEYITVDYLNSTRTGRIMDGPGTYRVHRPLTTVSVGVDLT